MKCSEARYIMKMVTLKTFTKYRLKEAVLHITKCDKCFAWNHDSLAKIPLKEREEAEKIIEAIKERYKA